MGQIVGGKVRVARTMRPADFESKVAEVELSFVADDGDYQAALDDAADVALKKVCQVLGLTQKGEPDKRQKRTTVPKPVDADVANTEKKDAALEVLEQMAQEEKSVASVDDLSDVLGEEPTKVEVIDDSQLLSEITHTLAGMNKKKKSDQNPVLIRNLISKHAPGKSPARAVDIAQDKRAAFVAELRSL